MGLLDSIRDAFSTKAKTDSGAEKIIPTGYEAQAVGFNGVSERVRTEYLEEMKGWVGACVTALADQVASINIRLYQYNKSGDVEEIDEHPILDLLFRVNTFTTKFDHFWLTQSYLELTGESPWFLERDGTGIVSIYFLRPDRLKPIIGSSRMIEGYEYDIGGGKKVPLTNEEVLFLKYPNPARPYRGIGTLEMAALTVDIDNYSEAWNRDFYKNSARPDSIINIKSANLTKEQKEKLVTSFDNQYKGEKNAHKTMLLFGEMEFNKSGFNQRDMDFLEQQRFSRDKILGIFRVPKAIVSQTEGVNYASAKVAEYIFAKYTVKPKMERLIQQLNEFLLPLFPGTENMYLDFDSPVPTDMEEKVKRYDSALSHGWMTINEVREEQGLENVDGGDELYLPSGLSTPEQLQNPYRPTLSVAPSKSANYNRIVETKVRGKKYFKAKETEVRVKKMIRETLLGQIAQQKKDAKIKKKNGEIQRVLTETEIKDFWHVKNKIFTEYLPEVTQAMAKVFKAQKKSVLIKLSKKAESTDDLYERTKLDVDKEVKRTLGIVVPIISELFTKAGNETYQLLELEAEMELTEQIKDLLESESRIFATTVTNTTNDEIRAQIEASLQEGESVSELKTRLSDYFDSAEVYRAERIARTETIRFNTAASEQAFIDSGMVESKMWVTDPNPCEYCGVFAGKTAPLGQNFATKGDTIGDRVFDYDDLPHPPLHPNCQCDIVPIFISQKIVRKD